MAATRTSCHAALTCCGEWAIERKQMHSPAIQYRVRVSPRSRNVRLRVSVKSGLEVIVPRGYDPDKVPSVLERKKRWIRAALERAEAHRKFFEPEPRWQVPTQISLPA